MIILSGPCGVGKSEIIKLFIKRNQYETIVPYTTRVRRNEEQDNVDYHFMNYHQLANISNCFEEGYWNCHIGNNWYGYLLNRDDIIKKDNLIIHAQSTMAIKMKCDIPDKITTVHLDFLTEEVMVKRIGERSISDDDYRERIKYSLCESMGRERFDFSLVGDNPYNHYLDICKIAMVEGKNL